MWLIDLEAAMPIMSLLADDIGIQRKMFVCHVESLWKTFMITVSDPRTCGMQSQWRVVVEMRLWVGFTEVTIS